MGVISIKLNFNELEFALGKNYKTEKLHFGLSAVRLDTWSCGCIRKGTATMDGGIGEWQDEFIPCEKHKTKFEHKVYPKEPVFQLKIV